MGYVVNDYPEFTSDRTKFMCRALKGAGVTSTCFWMAFLFPAFSAFWSLLVAGVIAGAAMTAQPLLGLNGLGFSDVIDMTRQRKELELEEGEV